MLYRWHSPALKHFPVTQTAPEPERGDEWTPRRFDIHAA
jgi:hypothetical protein